MTDHEARFATTVGAREAVAFRYARTALAVALEGLGLQPGDRVALSPLTCKVVPLTILATDLRPHYMEVDRTTLNLDPSGVESGGASRGGTEPGAIVVQHTYGLGGGVEEVLRAAASRGLPVIEDCAQVLPGHRNAGSTRGAAEVYSNNVGKPMPAGSGGMLATSDTDLANTARQRRSLMRRPGLGERMSGSLRRLGDRFVTPRTYWLFYDAYRTVAGGYRSRPLAAQIASEVDAVAGPPTMRQEALGDAMLGRLPELAAHRRACVQAYRERLQGSAAACVPEGAGRGPLYYFPVLTECKREVLDLARKRGIEIVPWPRFTPIYPLDTWDEVRLLGYERGMCPHAEWIADRLIGLPTHGRVRPRDMDRVVEVLSLCGR